MQSKYPILYSFRRCPYAMRARLALVSANIPVILREIDLQHKHPQFLSDSPKGTVPVLILNDATVLDESLDIVDYAFSQIPAEQLSFDVRGAADIKNELLSMMNAHFISAVTTFKYHERYTDSEHDLAKKGIHHFLDALNVHLKRQRYIVADVWSQADVIVFPFVRQLYRSDQDYFNGLPYQQVKRWLMDIIDSTIFLTVMDKSEVWETNQDPVILKIS
jgi:glutathione S-transferase